MSDQSGWTIGEWLSAYRQQQLTPRSALHALRQQLRAEDPAWIYILSADELDTQTQKRSGVTARKGGLEEEEEIVKPLRDNVPVFGRKRQR